MFKLSSKKKKVSAMRWHLHHLDCGSTEFQNGGAHEDEGRKKERNSSMKSVCLWEKIRTSKTNRVPHLLTESLKSEVSLQTDEVAL